MQINFKKITPITISCVAILAVLYHLLYTQWMILNPIEHQNLHYMFALSLVFLCSIRDATSTFGMITSVALLVLSLFATSYIFVNFYELEQLRGPILALTHTDIVVGILIIGLGIEASRRSFGIVFPLVATIFICYAFFGHHLSGIFQAPKLDLMDIITSFVMGLNGGIFGNVLGISANYIFLFVVFGGVLGVTGASEFFNYVGKLAGRNLSGGPAVSAIVSSALMGSVTGSVMANVATTGSFTIPLMKKVGYKPYQAGAIEAAASTGGQIMPPVMGATAFIFAEMAGVPYVDVMLAALLPALLYFFSLGVYAQLQAKKMRIDSTALGVGISARDFLLNAPLFILPLITITILLIMGFTPMYTIFWGLMLLLVLNVWHVWVRQKNFSALKKLIPAFTEGAITGAKIAVTCAVLGPIITTMTKTGLAIKIPSIISLWCGGSLFAALILTAVVCLILGMGLPTMAAYLIVGMVGTPTLIQMGVPIFSAHMFVFVFAVFSCITPPIAVAAIPAAGISGSSYLKTSFEASKIGVVGFLIPFMAIFTPDLMIGQGTGNAGMTCLYLGICALAVIFFSMATVGHAKRELTVVERLLSGIASACLVTILFPNSSMLVIFGALASGGILVVMQFRKARSFSPA